MKKLLLIALYIFSRSINAYNPDSLVALLKTNIHDTVREKILKNITIEYEFAGKPKEAEKFWGQLYEIAKKNNNKRWYGDYYSTLGIHFYFQRNYDSAIVNFEKCIAYYEIIKYHKGIIGARLNVAGIFIEKGEPKKSLAENRKIITAINRIKDTASLANAYANIGICYIDMSQYDSAIYYTGLASKNNEKYKAMGALVNNYCSLATINFNIFQYRKALYYMQEIEKRNLPQTPVIKNWVYGLTSKVYNALNKTDSAIFYIEKSITISKEMNDRYSLINALMNQAEIYGVQKKYSLAHSNMEECIRLSKEIESTTMLSHAYTGMGKILTLEKKFPEAINFFKLSNEMELNVNNSAAVIDNLKAMAAAYSGAGEFKASTEILDSLVKYKDRLNETAMIESLKDIETKYETEKKDLEILNANTKLTLQEEKNKQKEKIIWIGTIALTATLFFGVIAFLGFRRAKTANKIIHSQNQSLAIKNSEVEEQKQRVEEKQKEIIDSINYAKKIQAAVLAGEDSWRKVSKEYFVFFKPKDIVSGDFYWAYNTPNNRSVFALADCTGHGVPGGFMSMLGNSFLNEIVIENKIFNAASILNKLRDKIINALEQNTFSEQKDGMDMALCVWNKLNNTLEFAGANNALMILRDNKILEVKGDKMPVGIYLGEDKPFTSQTIQLQSGDCLYMTTDGFPDQFGGPKGKKFKYRQTEDLLIEIHNTPFNEQEKVIEKRFREWKGKLEQIDDVTLIGIKV